MLRLMHSWFCRLLKSHFVIFKDTAFISSKSFSINAELSACHNVQIDRQTDGFSILYSRRYVCMHIKIQICKYTHTLYIHRCICTYMYKYIIIIIIVITLQISVCYIGIYICIDTYVHMYRIYPYRNPGVYFL